MNAETTTHTGDDVLHSESITMRMLATFCRLLPIRSGIGTISESLSGRFTSLRRETEVACSLRNGVRILARLNDYNGRMLYLFGTPDPKIVTICRDLLRSGDVFLDIGANYGSVGLLVHDAVIPGGSVHFVEPQPELAGRIKNAISENRITNSAVHQCGLWDEAGELFITVSHRHTGTASISSEPSSDVSQRVEVLDIKKFLPETVGDQHFGVKLDVEGAEVRILPELLTNPRLRFVLFEAHDPEVKAFVERMMNDGSHTFFGVSKDIFRTRLFPILSNDNLRASHDVLAVRLKPGSHPTHKLSTRKLKGLIA